METEYQSQQRIGNRTGFNKSQKVPLIGSKNKYRVGQEFEIQSVASGSTARSGSTAAFTEAHGEPDVGDLSIFGRTGNLIGVPYKKYQNKFKKTGSDLNTKVSSRKQNIHRLINSIKETKSNNNLTLRQRKENVKVLGQKLAQQQKKLRVNIAKLYAHKTHARYAIKGVNLDKNDLFKSTALQLLNVKNNYNEAYIEEFATLLKAAAITHQITNPGMYTELLEKKGITDIEGWLGGRLNHFSEVGRGHFDNIDVQALSNALGIQFTLYDTSNISDANQNPNVEMINPPGGSKQNYNSPAFADLFSGRERPVGLVVSPTENGLDFKPVLNLGDEGRLYYQSLLRGNKLLDRFTNYATFLFRNKNLNTPELTAWNNFRKTKLHNEANENFSQEDIQAFDSEIMHHYGEHALNEPPLNESDENLVKNLPDLTKLESQELAIASDLETVLNGAVSPEQILPRVIDDSEKMADVSKQIWVAKQQLRNHMYNNERIWRALKKKNNKKRDEIAVEGRSNREVNDEIAYVKEVEKDSLVNDALNKGQIFLQTLGDGVLNSNVGDETLKMQADMVINKHALMLQAARNIRNEAMPDDQRTLNMNFVNEIQNYEPQLINNVETLNEQRNQLQAVASQLNVEDIDANLHDRAWSSSEQAPLGRMFLERSQEISLDNHPEDQGIYGFGIIPEQERVQKQLDAGRENTQLHAYLSQFSSDTYRLLSSGSHQLSSKFTSLGRKGVEAISTGLGVGSQLFKNTIGGLFQGISTAANETIQNYRQQQQMKAEKEAKQQQMEAEKEAILDMKARRFAQHQSFLLDQQQIEANRVRNELKREELRKKEEEHRSQRRFYQELVEREKQSLQAAKDEKNAQREKRIQNEIQRHQDLAVIEERYRQSAELQRVEMEEQARLLEQEKEELLRQEQAAAKANEEELQHALANRMQTESDPTILGALDEASLAARAQASNEIQQEFYSHNSTQPYLYVPGYNQPAESQNESQNVPLTEEQQEVEQYVYSHLGELDQNEINNFYRLYAQGNPVHEIVEEIKGSRQYYRPLFQDENEYTTNEAQQYEQEYPISYQLDEQPQAAIQDYNEDVRSRTSTKSVSSTEVNYQLYLIQQEKLEKAKEEALERYEAADNAYREQADERYKKEPIILEQKPKSTGTDERYKKEPIILEQKPKSAGTQSAFFQSISKKPEAAQPLIKKPAHSTRSLFSSIVIDQNKEPPNPPDTLVQASVDVRNVVKSIQKTKIEQTQPPIVQSQPQPSKISDANPMTTLAAGEKRPPFNPQLTLNEDISRAKKNLLIIKKEEEKDPQIFLPNFKPLQVMRAAVRTESILDSNGDKPPDKLPKKKTKPTTQIVLNNRGIITDIKEKDQEPTQPFLNLSVKPNSLLKYAQKPGRRETMVERTSWSQKKKQQPPLFGTTITFEPPEPVHKEPINVSPLNTGFELLNPYKTNFLKRPPPVSDRSIDSLLIKRRRPEPDLPNKEEERRRSKRIHGFADDNEIEAAENPIVNLGENIHSASGLRRHVHKFGLNAHEYAQNINSYHIRKGRLIERLENAARGIPATGNGYPSLRTPFRIDDIIMNARHPNYKYF